MNNSTKAKFKFEKRKVYLMLIVITILGTVGFSLAFYTVNIVNEGKVDVNITLEENDVATLEYTISENINFHLNDDNFYEGAGNVTSQTTGVVTLTSEEAYETNYAASFYIKDNTFTYATDSGTAEILLVITDPNESSYAEAIAGLEYVTVTTSEGTFKGYDITEANGLYVIDDQYVINTTSSSLTTAQNWTAEVIFLNLDEDQSDNQGNSIDCYFSFGDEAFDLDLITFKYDLLAAYGGADVIEAKTDPSYSAIATEEDSGMYATEDVNGGTTYYYRGLVNDNWVYFAGSYWRIIRIDEDGNIKMIYAGETVTTADNGITSTAEQTINSNTAFNSSRSSYYYVGYVYSTTSLHGTTTDSLIKGVVDDWYETNIENTEYDSYLATTTYCIDREAWSSSSSFKDSTFLTGSTSSMYYGAYKRLEANKTPSLECNNSADKLSLKAGLISADEVALAGGVKSIGNNSYYLYTNATYWTLSPCCFSSGFGNVWGVNGSGHLGTYNATYTYGARAAVSLNSSTLIIKGSGVYTDPYIVTEADADDVL